MKAFIFQILKFSSGGFIIVCLIIISYFIFDPFKVLYDYSDYSNPYIISNRDNVSTEMFEKNKNKYNYNSFIFGSSRTIAYRPSTWQKYISKNDSPYMFDASGESVYGIYTKIKYLDEIDWEIKNALIILCEDCSFINSKNPKGHLNIHHPLTTKESIFNYHFSFFRDYFNLDFLLRYYTYKLTGNYYKWMKGYIETREIVFDTITNEISLVDLEREIEDNMQNYYAEREKLFYPRSVDELVDSVASINEEQQFMLMEIKRILQKRNTNYKVIISPLYNQIKINIEDKQILESIFGDNIYDFSGKNEFTESVYNYYETSHYRPNVGDSILNLIYSH